jgi:hypothetical protein
MYFMPRKTAVIRLILATAPAAALAGVVAGVAPAAKNKIRS